MAADREMSAEPSEERGKDEEGEGVPATREGEAKVRAVGLGERPHLSIQERERRSDDDEREGAACESLQQAGVIERPADEAVGRADQLRDFDLFALREDL